MLCALPTTTDLEFKLIYVGSADDETKDQVLDEVLLGPVDTGNYRFVFQVGAPAAVRPSPPQPCTTGGCARPCIDTKQGYCWRYCGAFDLLLPKPGLCTL